jgi:hypothetical protein
MHLKAIQIEIIWIVHLNQTMWISPGTTLQGSINSTSRLLKKSFCEAVGV